MRKDPCHVGVTMQEYGERWIYKRGIIGGVVKENGGESTQAW